MEVGACFHLELSDDAALEIFTVAVRIPVIDAITDRGSIALRTDWRVVHWHKVYRYGTRAHQEEIEA